jgi:hypothetical protein
MRNLVEVSDQIKAVASSCTGTPTAKLIALLNAAGITKATEIAAILGISDRAVRKAKAELQDRNHSSAGTTGPEPQDRAEPQFRNSSSETGTTVPESALARVLDNNKLTSLEDSSENNKTPLPPTKTKGPGTAEALEAFNAYNATALECGLPQAAKLTPDRQRNIIARLKDYGLEGWTQALANIEKSSFLTGTNDRGWRANLDFLLQPASFAKVHDGGYGNGRHAAKQAAKVEYHYPAWYLEEVASMGGRA